MVFGSAENHGGLVHLDGIKLQKVNCCKYLGIFIDCNMKWSEHIDYIYNKLIKFVGIFYKLRNKLPIAILRDIYFAFVYPHLIYGIELYGNTCPSYLDKLGKLNNKLLRILQGKDRRSPTVELYLTYNTLPVLQLHDLQILLFVHKCLHHGIALPLLFSNYFSMNNVVHDYKTRQSNLLHLHSTSTQYGKRCIQNKGCTLWNNLPNHLQNYMSIHQFKTLVKRYLQECYYVDVN